MDVMTATLGDIKAWLEDMVAAHPEIIVGKPYCSSECLIAEFVRAKLGMYGAIVGPHPTDYTKGRISYYPSPHPGPLASRPEIVEWADTIEDRLLSHELNRLALNFDTNFNGQFKATAKEALSFVERHVKYHAQVVQE